MLLDCLDTLVSDFLKGPLVDSVLMIIVSHLDLNLTTIIAHRDIIICILVKRLWRPKRLPHSLHVTARPTVFLGWAGFLLLEILYLDISWIDHHFIVVL